MVDRNDRLISRDDEEVSETVREIMENEGIEIRLQAECMTLRKHEQGVAIQVESDSGAPEVVGSHLLMAVGRAPNTHDLGLDKAGIETDERGFIVVDDQLRTNVSNVWATGDVNGRGAFTHTSYNDYEIVVANLFDNDPRAVSDRITAYGLFVDPPLGRVGMTERKVRASGRKALVGIGGDEIIHSIIDIMCAGAPYTTIQRAMHIHPTVAELIPTVRGDLRRLE